MDYERVPAQQVAKFREVTVYLPGVPPIQIAGARVIAVGAQPGLPTMVSWFDEMGRPNQVLGAILHVVAAEPAEQPRLVRPAGWTTPGSAL
jgi:hypothetical protein